MRHDNTGPLYGVDLWGPRGAWEREVEREESERRWADLEEQTRSLGPQKCGSGRKIVTYYRTMPCSTCEGTGIDSAIFIMDGVERVESWPCRACEGAGRVEVLANEETGERKVVQCLCCGKQLQEGEECR